MSYLINFFISIDQLGNVIAGGNPDNTISSRVGYYTRYHESDKNPWHWKIFEAIIDFTFYPIDGPEHCHQAYHSDAGEVFDENTSDILIAVLALLIIPSCLLISLILYPLLFLGVVSPKNIDRNKNMIQRLETVEAKLNGTLHELNEYAVDVDEKLKEQLEKTKTKMYAVAEKIIAMVDLKARADSRSETN